MKYPRAHPYGRSYTSRYRVVGIRYGRKFLFGYAQTQQRAQQLLAELKRMGLRGEIIPGARCESNPPPRLGTVWTARAVLYDKNHQAIGTCMDTPNAIAKAFMEVPRAMFVKFDHPLSGFEHRSRYSERMASWNVAQSMFEPIHQRNPRRPMRNPRVRRRDDYEEYDIPPGVSERELEVAIDTFEKFHDFGPDKIEKVSIPNPKVLTNLGEWIGVIYFSDKWKNQKKLKQYHKGKRGQGYIHEFKDKAKRRVMFVPSKKNSEYGTLVAIGPAKVTKHGIEDVK